MNIFKIFVLSVLVCLSGSASAQVLYGEVGIDSNSQAGAVSGSESRAGSIATGGSGGSSSANNHGNRVGVVSYGSDLSRAHKNTPSVIAPSIQTGSLTDSCLGSFSSGIAGAGFGATFGKSYVDEACVRRLHAKFLSTAGQGELAMAIMCEDKFVAEASAALSARTGKIDTCTGKVAGADEADETEEIAQADIPQPAPADNSGTNDEIFR